MHCLGSGGSRYDSNINWTGIRAGREWKDIKHVQVDGISFNLHYAWPRKWRPYFCTVLFYVLWNQNLTIGSSWKLDKYRASMHVIHFTWIFYLYFISVVCNRFCWEANGLFKGHFVRIWLMSVLGAFMIRCLSVNLTFKPISVRCVLACNWMAG